MKIDWLKLENRIKATPLDLLKQGIEQGQWEAVCAAYTMLTGIVLKPVFEDNKPEDNVEADRVIKENKNENNKNEDIYEDEDDDNSEDDEDEDEDEDEEDDSELDDDEDDDEDEEGEHRIKRNRSKIHTRSSPVSFAGRKNEFVDDGSEAAEDLAFMPKPEVLQKRRKKRRPEYKTVRVRCSKCGASERVDPDVAPTTLNKGKYKMRYVCNECSCGGGS